MDSRLTTRAVDFIETSTTAAEPRIVAFLRTPYGAWGTTITNLD
jgi:hypothetical protein